MQHCFGPRRFGATNSRAVWAGSALSAKRCLHFGRGAAPHPGGENANTQLLLADPPRINQQTMTPNTGWVRGRAGAQTTPERTRGTRRHVAAAGGDWPPW